MGNDRLSQNKDAHVESIAHWLRQNIWIPRYGQKGKSNKGPLTLARKISQLDRGRASIRPRSEPYVRAVLTEASTVEFLNQMGGDLGKAVLASDEIDKAGADLIIFDEDRGEILGGFDVKSSVVRAENSGHYIRTQLPFPVGTIGVNPQDLGVDDMMISMARGNPPESLTTTIRRVINQGRHEIGLTFFLPHSLRNKLYDAKGEQPQRSLGIDLHDYMNLIQDRIWRWTREDTEWENEPTNPWEPEIGDEIYYDK